MAKAFMGKCLARLPKTSRSHNSSEQPALVESGKCCIFVRYRTKVAVARSASLAAFDVKAAMGALPCAAASARALGPGFDAIAVSSGRLC